MSTDDTEVRTSAFVGARFPLLQEELQRQIADGADIAELIGLVCDGKGFMGRVGEMTTVVPRSIALSMTRVANDIPEFAPALQLLHEPVPGTFLVLIFFEENPGFAAYQYATLRHGARA